MQEAKQKELTVIEQIHNDFYGAEERILQQAKAIVNEPFTELRKRAAKAKSLGFVSSKPVKELNEALDNQDRLVQASTHIQHYQQRYPFNKFITEKEVRALCEKWGLCLGDVSNYIGDIPEKNMEEMAAFRVDEKDIVVDYYGESPAIAAMQDMLSRLGNGGIRDFDFEVTNDSFGIDQELGFTIPRREITIKSRSPRLFFHPDDRIKTDRNFKICAPKKDFDLTGRAIVGHKIEAVPVIMDLDDPIVLQPVNGGYLIVTAWGPEASDPSVVNEINN